ncbi:MAG TPA: phenylacetic acid degradation bifunctional protein PaaZ [Oceanospirillales bacterium]|nr:phenylacetic acid degradation bifunctional protein PaaZ [Oceanospirillales bacterium]
MSKLQSYAKGQWYTATDGFRPCFNALNGEKIFQISSAGLDFSGMLDYAKSKGGKALRAMTFHERALMLKELALYLLSRKKEFYQLSFLTGATKLDSWIDIEGGIGTLFVYSGKGRRELPDHNVFVDGNLETLSASDQFIGQHICTSLQGVAIHINAFNFPCWGMLEKLAPTLLAGVPAVVKPASNTSFLTEHMFRAMIESKILPEGAVQLICGSTGDLLDNLDCQDAVAFTGSATTGQYLKSNKSIMHNSVRFTMEADSLNCSILTPDTRIDSPEFDFYVKEVVREMTVKCGQKCTAIRRAIVPRELLSPVADAVSEGLARIAIGDPLTEGVKMGSLASEAQRVEVRERVSELSKYAEFIYGNPDEVETLGADSQAGAFINPILLACENPLDDTEVHDIEAFGPVSTLMPYDSLDEAAQLANMGQGSLVGSIFGYDDEIVSELVMNTASFHGRMVLINRDCAQYSTGHGSPLPHMTHGGPGRAGGGEEMGGIRGVMHYMQRTALQGSPTTISKICNKYIGNAKTIKSAKHPFRLYFEELQIGQTLISQPRTITLEDIEQFAELSGDKFYAHMDEQAASDNPFFDGRVAHGYFIVSMAAGLFVEPNPGPVLANYGVDDLRFTEPVYPGDDLVVRLTCKQKSYRRGKGYGEVRWDIAISNQDDEVVAQYDILTMVASNVEEFCDD